MFFSILFYNTYGSFIYEGASRNYLDKQWRLFDDDLEFAVIHNIDSYLQSRDHYMFGGTSTAYVIFYQKQGLPTTRIHRDSTMVDLNTALGNLNIRIMSLKILYSIY